MTWLCTDGVEPEPHVVADSDEWCPICYPHHHRAPPRLPTDPEARKKLPLASGCIDYFPDALAAVAAVSQAGMTQHQTTCWDRSKSMDQDDTLIRHFLERGTKDTDGLRHSAKMAWRSLALLQLEIEEELGLPPSRGSSPHAASRKPPTKQK
jgi:hypothetical protein